MSSACIMRSAYEIEVTSALHKRTVPEIDSLLMPSNNFLNGAPTSVILTIAKVSTRLESANQNSEK